MQFDTPNIEKRRVNKSQHQALEAFFSNPSGKTLDEIHLRDPELKYDKLKALISRVEDSYREKRLPIIVQLLFKCLSRLAKMTAERGKYEEAEDCLKRILEIDPRNKMALMSLASLGVKRGRDAEAQEYKLKYLDTKQNKAFRKYKIIRNLIIDGQPENRREAEKLIIELLQTLPAEGEQDLKFLILCAFYKLSPEHELWPILENETGITKESVAKLAYKETEINSLEKSYLKGNSL